MRVAVILVNENETVLEGEAPVFGGKRDYKEGYNSRLDDIGFWLSDWRYAGLGGPNHKSRVFVPWCSALYIEEMKQ